jgi:hypothetical protein
VKIFLQEPLIPDVTFPIMKFTICLFVALLCPISGTAEEKLIFEDDFERSESDDSKEEIGNGWTSNSAKRAKGNKQVDLKEDRKSVV